MLVHARACLRWHTDFSPVYQNQLPYINSIIGDLIRVLDNTVSSNHTISLLGLESDKNFSTTPYLYKLAREASTRAALIKRLSYRMPKCLLKPLSNGLLMGKILSAAPAALPIKLSPNDKSNVSSILTDIDKTIRATARTITHIKLTDKVRTETVLSKAGLRSLTQAVSETMAISIWKSRREMNSLGRLFQTHVSERYQDKLLQPIPGYPDAASNKLAQIWNSMKLSNASTLGNARSLAQNSTHHSYSDFQTDLYFFHFV